MRIAMVTSAGSDIPVDDLSDALAGSGHEVLVHNLRTPSGDGASRRLESSVAALRKKWAATPPDVVHTHRWSAGLAALLAARPLGIPVVHTFQDAVGGPVERINVERAVCRVAARVVATSGDELPSLLRLGVRRTRIAVVPYGIDSQRFGPDGPRAPRRSAYRIVTAALNPVGDAGELVNALRVLPDTELVVLDGPQSLDDHAARAGVADRVVREPAGSHDLAALLRSADIVVCGPWCDRPSILAMQAMACGVAVVATTADGGVSDVVVNQVTGMIPAQRTRGGLPRVLSGLLADEARRESYATAGADRAQARFGLDRVAAEIADVYASAVDGDR